MMTGSCLCGAVGYEITGETGQMGHCHCRMCQRAHGAAYTTYLQVSPAGFAFTRGESDVRRYRSSEDTTRTFCGRCGTSLQFIRDGRDHFGVAVGTQDEPPAKRPDYEIWTSVAAPWGARDGISQTHPTQPGPRGEREGGV